MTDWNDQVLDLPERSPEEAVLIMRLRVFVNMRWFAIIGVVIATLVASLVFDIGFPTLPVYIICVFVALYNLLLLWQVRSPADGKSQATNPEGQGL